MWILLPWPQRDREGTTDHSNIQLSQTREPGQALSAEPNNNSTHIRACKHTNTNSNFNHYLFLHKCIFFFHRHILHVSHTTRTHIISHTHWTGTEKAEKQWFSTPVLKTSGSEQFQLFSAHLIQLICQLTSPSRARLGLEWRTTDDHHNLHV